MNVSTACRYWMAQRIVLEKPAIFCPLFAPWAAPTSVCIIHKVVYAIDVANKLVDFLSILVSHIFCAIDKILLMA